MYTGGRKSRYVETIGAFCNYSLSKENNNYNLDEGFPSPYS
jgi:hypothetical protein